MGALVTLELPEDSPVRDLPWIITFGPLRENDEWEPVVCGPYERPHALALAEQVVADEDLMAVVEPLLAFAAPDEMRAEIDVARSAGATGPGGLGPDGVPDSTGGLGPDGVPETGTAPDAVAAPERGLAHPAATVPDAGEIRAGMGRIAARIASEVAS